VTSSHSPVGTSLQRFRFRRPLRLHLVRKRTERRCRAGSREVGVSFRAALPPAEWRTTRWRRNCCVRSDYLGFVAPLVTLAVAGWPSGSSAPCSTRFPFSKDRGVAALVNLASPSERRRTAESDSRLTRLSWDSFARALPPTSPSRVHSWKRPESPTLARRRPLVAAPSAARCHARRLFRPRGFSPPRRFAPRDGSGCFATRASQGSLRCWCRRPPPPGKPDPEARPEGPKLLVQPGTEAPNRDTVPAARAPFEEPSPSTGGDASLHPRCLLEVASQSVRTRRSFPTVRPPARPCSVDVCEPPPSPLPVPKTARVLPWASVPASQCRPRPTPHAGL